MGKEAKTNAMRILERAKVACTAHEYPHEEGVAVDGVTVAAIIGVAGAGTAVIVWQGYRIGMELYEKYFQPTPEETVVEEPALEGQMTDPIS